jgi:hypothetical protein
MKILEIDGVPVPQEKENVKRLKTHDSGDTGKTPTHMKVIFWRPRCRLPQTIKNEICRSIKNNYWSGSRRNFYIHFDVMLPRAGWYSGYVDTWQRWRDNPYQQTAGKRRKHFLVRFLSWE